MDTEPVVKSRSNKFNLSVDLRIIILLLLAVIAAMLLIWKPWVSANKSADRTVQVTGDAKLTATPDEYTFSPSYEFKNSNKDAALAELTKKNEEIVAKLKTLGVPDKKIKSDFNGSDYPVYYEEDPQNTNYVLRLTVAVGTRELAQKVQDYLITTSPTGAVSPQASFSDAKRKQLENQARDEATKDARAKADQSAKNLGFKLGSVKSVSDSTGFDIMPYAVKNGLAATSEAALDTTKLSLQPGENDLNYSVTVSYYIR